MKFKLEFDNLKQIIKEKCKSKKVIYFPNPGNWGDGILRYATLKLFEDICTKLSVTNNYINY